MENFAKYLRKTYGTKSGTTSSYLTAIKILDEIFKKEDILNLKGRSLVSISDAGELFNVIEVIHSEEKKMKTGADSIFKYGKSKQTSYPKGGFCSAAVKSLFNYRLSSIQEDAVNFTKKTNSKKKIITHLSKITSISNTETNVEVHQRIGQNIFRSVILEIYDGKCCVCGLNINDLLRASHISPWSDDKKNRLNPENGLCLSATYDAAFDRHLISFDQDYKMVVSKYIKEFYTNETAKEYFDRFEGKQLILPKQFMPDKKLLQKHIEKLII